MNYKVEKDTEEEERQGLEIKGIMHRINADQQDQGVR